MAIFTDTSSRNHSLALALVKNSYLPALLFDDDLRIMAASQSFCGSFGIPRNTTDGATLPDLGQGEWGTSQLDFLLEGAFAEGPEIDKYEMELIRPGLMTRHLSLNARKITYDDEINNCVLLTIEDVTEIRIANRERADLLHDSTILLEEMRHRVANSLQIIASILLLKAKAVQSAETKLHLEDAHERIMSVANIQSYLRFGNGDIEVKPYLTKLCDSLAASMIRGSRPIILIVDADDASVTSRQGVSYGLLVTELVINALKHAFPDGRSGQISVGYHIDPAIWTLSVADNGCGMPKPPSSIVYGLGSSVIAALAKQLGATLSITDNNPGVAVAVMGSRPTAHPEAPRLPN